MKEYRYLALGDSYTIGEGVEMFQSFPWQLVHSLEKEGYALHGCKIIATTGWTSEDLIAALDNSTITDSIWDIITLLVGVNNQYQQRNIHRYKEEYSQLLHKALKLVDNRPERIIGVSIPDYSVTPFAKDMDIKKINYELNEYNSTAKGLLNTIGGKWVNITGISRDVSHDRTMLASDGLHPSARQYALWVEKIRPEFLNSMING